MIYTLWRALKLSFHSNYILCFSYIMFFFIYKITGTGHGMGKELAIQYACLGAKVVCLDVNEQTNEETVKEINDIGKNAYAYQYVNSLILIFLFLMYQYIYIFIDSQNSQILFNLAKIYSNSSSLHK